MVRSGSVRTGLVRTEMTWTGSVRTGLVRTGSVRIGPEYMLHTTYRSTVDIDIRCYRTTGTYPCIVLILDYEYKELDGVE